jgi:hypothetical protein
MREVVNADAPESTELTAEEEKELEVKRHQIENLTFKNQETKKKLAKLQTLRELRYQLSALPDSMAMK